ncbi:MAG: AsnC family transcriptional regulator [Dehalococcoidia bacterium]|jgi:DNA-binding Lrp family transcriptional regulator
MLDTDLDILDRRLLGLAQREFPLTRSPYADLGRKLDMSGDEVMRRLGKLKSDGLLRQIGPIVDASRLGYRSTLAAMKVDGAKLEDAVQVMTAHVGISHAYVRDNEYNVWFTLAVPQEAGIEAEVESIARDCGAASFMSLPAVKVFKLRTYFDMGGDSSITGGVNGGVNLSSKRLELTRLEKIVINELQQDLPLSPAPFAAMASNLGMDEGGFLEACASLVRSGVIRRYGASLDHNRAGYSGNVLTCWYASPDSVDRAGRSLAAFKEVSHCYERKAPEGWKYNLFAMLHGRDRESCMEAIGRLSAACGLNDYIALFTVRELKKTRIKYII